MDREEVSVLMPIIQNLGYNENDLRTHVSERFSQGKFYIGLIATTYLHYCDV